MVNTCDEHEDGVYCHGRRECPICLEILDLKNQIENLEAKVEDLNNRLIEELEW